MSKQVYSPARFDKNIHLRENSIKQALISVTLIALSKIINTACARWPNSMNTLDDRSKMPLYKKMRTERFFKHDLLPFVEARYSKGSTTPFKQHMHRSFSIGAVNSGEVVYQVKGRAATLAPGSLAVINPETLHACNPAGGTGRSYSMLYLDPNWCLKVQHSMWKIERFVESEKIRVDDRNLYLKYCHLIDQMMDKQVHLQEKEQLLFDLACDVFKCCCSPQKKREDSAEDIEHLKVLLQEDLQKDMPLELLAESLGGNPYTLIRRFRKITGITPHAYRMNCRIDKARQYLQAGTDITETALLCGFFDQSHLHRHFKSMTTITPREYRVNFVQD